MDVFDYADHLQRLEACRAQGFGFGEALAILDQMPLESKQELVKYHRVSHRDHYGLEVIGAPFMGEYREIVIEQAAAFTRMVMCDYLRRFITPDLGAVVEVSCGVGDTIISLARDHFGSKTKFYATDVSETGLKCANILSDMARTDNVEVKAVDIFTTDWRFIPQPALFFICNSFSGMSEGAATQFLNRLPDCRFCIFEPIGPQLDMLNKAPLDIWPGKTLDSRNQFTWPEIKRAIDAGTFELERIIPDMAGWNLVYSLSLVQILKGPAF